MRTPRIHYTAAASARHQHTLNLNSNPIQNIEIANPQRQFMVKEESNNNIINTKISNYNFIQTKNYKQDLNVNFKKNN